ncbi:hypothetical protein DSECCO2_456710 [anaerobic digester metagenome]
MDRAAPTAAWEDAAKPPATMTTVVASAASMDMSPTAVKDDPPVTRDVIVSMTMDPETEPPKANFSPPAPPRVTPTSVSPAEEPRSMVEPESMSEPSTRVATVLKARFSPRAAPTAACDVDTATPPDTATQTSVSVAEMSTAPPALMTLSTMPDSTVLMKRFRAAEPARANFSAPAPATVTPTTTAPSEASAVNAPPVFRVERSVLVRTVLATLLTAMDTPPPKVLPTPRAPAKLKMPVKSLADRV